MITKRNKIFINGRFLTQKVTGINRFAFELCNALAESGIDLIIIAPKKIQPGYKLRSRVEFFGLLNGPLWEQLDLLYYLLRHGRPFLLSFSGLGPLFYKNKIITIHDLAFLSNPSWYSKSYYWFYRFATPVAARYSEKILTVSNFSKGEIVRLLGIQEIKISIVNNACAWQPADPLMTERKIERKYILSVSSVDPRKNLPKLIEAYHKSGLATEYKLVLVGKADKVFNIQLSANLEKYSIGYVTDDELQVLYLNASLFVYPSLYEGFGIPPLEAMSQGCAAVISDIPVFREVFGDAACFVDPGNAGSISDGMIRVLSNPGYRDELIRQGINVASRYSWKKSAVEIKEILTAQVFSD